MSDGGNRMIQYHSRACPTHHFAYSLPHIGTIAVDRAFTASGLVLAELAMRESQLGILQQLCACRAQLSVTFLLTAVQTYHLLHDLLFFPYPAHLRVSALVYSRIGQEYSFRQMLLSQPHRMRNQRRVPICVPPKRRTNSR